MVDKKALSKRDICTKYITPAIERAGWDTITQMREEVSFTDGRIMHRGQQVVRVKPSGLTTFSTTSPTSPWRSSKRRTTNTRSRRECSRRWIMPRRSSCPSCSAPTVHDLEDELGTEWRELGTVDARRHEHSPRQDRSQTRILRK